MAGLAEPRQAGEVAYVRIALGELPRLVAACELVDRQAGAAPYLAREESLVLAFVEFDDGSV